MDNTRAQQKALDDELVAPANRLKIRKSNLRLSSNLISKEPTLQVVLDALKLTLFYKAFEIIADVPDIYMQEFWVTVSRHHSSLHFKLNGKSHTVNVDNFKDMLKICPKLPGQIFEEPPLEKEILSFIRDLGHTGEIKFLSDVNVNHMHQPWRSFAVKKIPKPKYVKNKADSESSPKKKTATTTKGKRLKTSAKADKPAKKKQPAKTSKAKGLTVLSKVALIESKQIKLATKRSLIETHSSYASGSGADEGTGSNQDFLIDDDDEDNDDDDNADDQDDDDQEDDGQHDEDQDDFNEKTNSDNDGDDFVHPKLSTQDQEVRHNEEESDEEIQGANVEEEELDEEEINDEDKANELYMDVNVNLEGRDIEMTYA
ncbi:hypothetical protein Tco_1031690 [Tanacetum coccineum]|uniref:Uncharacterized protein n=1 Tax=Tanacetum coccineum TaxID=301880 RepID=A0ABQ5GAJ0_9ASTR